MTGGKILDKDPLATDIPNTPDIQQKWVEHIVSKFGNSAKSGIIYQMDNEVSNWAYPLFSPFYSLSLYSILLTHLDSCTATCILGLLPTPKSLTKRSYP